MARTASTRSAKANEYRKLYRTASWLALRSQALQRDLYTCQRCRTMLVQGASNSPRSAVVHHKTAHKGDLYLFYYLGNVESVCKACHDTRIQAEEARGYTIGHGSDGRPIDPYHPWNR